jgi:hypothetical protein
VEQRFGLRFDGFCQRAQCAGSGGGFFHHLVEVNRGGRVFAGGLAHSISQDSSIALSVERQQQDHGEQDQTLVQAGLWRRLAGGGPTLGLGAGFGIGRDSPSFVLGLTATWTIGE